MESSKISSQVIITTAYQEYALKGYELQITDYLLKPFTFNRFLQTVFIVFQMCSQISFFVKTKNRLKKIMLNEIVYIEGMRDYLRIHTINKKIMTLQNFSEIEKLIPLRDM